MKINWIFIRDICSITLLVIDLFCGAGGTTSGFENSRVDGKKVVMVIACVNHDPNAIRSHALNHPNTKHFTEDIRVQAMEPIVAVLKKWKALCPSAKVVLWGSLECTNHSNAKGGESRDADSRSLADHLDRYIIALKPDYIWIENVREFRLWGPLVQKINKKTGKPVFHRNKKTKELEPTMVPDKTRLCIYFNRWRKATMALGYDYDDIDLNAANFDAHQNRVRYFGSFVRKGMKHIFPVPFTKRGRAVKEVLDFTDEGESIFDPNRTKPIESHKTILRVKAGTLRHVIPGRQSWLVKFTNHGNGAPNPGVSLENPAPTLCVRQHLQVANAVFMSKYFSGGHQSTSIEYPAGTITAKDHHAKVDCTFIMQRNHSNAPLSVEKPARTVTTKG